MNSGWLRINTPDSEYDRVVLHEFGHALGLIHEHQNPNGNPIKWDRKKVIEYYKVTQDWDSSFVEKNIFRLYEKDKTLGTTFDEKSIMLYSIPKQLTTDGLSTARNTELSSKDKEFIGFLYPKK